MRANQAKWEEPKDTPEPSQDELERYKRREYLAAMATLFGIMLLLYVGWNV